MNGTSPEPAGSRLVWDLPLRITHWMLVACACGSWATHYAGAEWFTWHARLGYTTLVLVCFRVVWGFVGPRHARFASFVAGPRALVDHLRGRRPAPSVGHNPLGALSVLAMLSLLLVQAGSGLFASDEIVAAGPFYGWIAPSTSQRLTALHRANSEVLLALLVLHVVAVLWYERVRGRRLVVPMITGRRPAAEVEPAAAITSSKTLRACLIVLLLAGLLALAIHAAPEAIISLY